MLDCRCRIIDGIMKSDSNSLFEAASCPFCGQSLLVLGVDRIPGIRKEDEGSPAARVVTPYYSVRCKYCGTIGPTEQSAEDAIYSWNYRTANCRKTLIMEVECGDDETNKVKDY